MKFIFALVVLFCGSVVADDWVLLGKKTKVTAADKVKRDASGKEIDTGVPKNCDFGRFYFGTGDRGCGNIVPSKDYRGECTMSVDGNCNPADIKRTFVFSNDNQILIRDQYGSGKDSANARSRVIYIVPRTGSDLKYRKMPNGELYVELLSGQILKFGKNGGLEDMIGAGINYSSKIDRADKNLGLKINRLDASYLIDIGPGAGDLLGKRREQIENLTARVTSPEGRVCTLKAKEITYASTTRSQRLIDDDQLREKLLAYCKFDIYKSSGNPAVHSDAPAAADHKPKPGTK